MKDVELLRETIRIIIESEHVVVRRGDKLYVVDDEGNNDYYGPVVGSSYEHLADGETAQMKQGLGPRSRGPRRGRR